MVRKLLLMLALPWLFTLVPAAEELPPLRECQTVEQVEALLLYPDGGQPVPVEAGRVRYIPQDTNNDPDFCADYWLGGEPGDELDLTLEENPNRIPYEYYARNMCTRAVYSMALSYLGVDLTPGGMSAMTERRVVTAHYDETTDMLPQVERVSFSSYVFQNMFEAYQADEHYSPVYLYFRRPSGTTHAVLVVARREDGRYIVIDPRYREKDGETVRVYTIALNKFGQVIVNSDFRSEQTDSVVLACCQWRLVGEE